MWICPICGREFKQQNEDRFCWTPINEVDHYITKQPEDVQLYLFSICRIIRQSIPQAEERISWGMPAFWNQQMSVVQFAAGRHTVNIYVGSAAVEKFRYELVPFRAYKGTIYLPYHSKIPKELLTKIAKWCYKAAMHSEPSNEV